MKKQKTVWICDACGASFPKWSGQCQNCQEWNSLIETEPQIESVQKNGGAVKKPAVFKDFADFNQKQARLSTKIEEFDRVLGGGILSDSISLLVGNPGIGKSTLALQTALNIAEQKKKVLIVSAEESVEQIFARALRISRKELDINVLNEFYVENILKTAQQEKPDLLIVDSVQTVSSGDFMSLAGSTSQVRAVTEKLMQFAKSTKTPVLLIGHVTKEGEMAGPQLLAHLVDAVFVIEGDPQHEFRILRAIKNRFGSVQEIGVFQMMENGLIEVKNPSEAFLGGRLENAVGSVVFPAVEGSRSFLVEVQALTSTTRFGLPKRVGSGVSLSRLSLIIAILQNHAKINLENKDIFVNIIGGFKLSEPALDLALALAIVSSVKNKSLADDLIACGEMGLTGEVRAVSFLEKRLQEGQKMGFCKAVIPANTKDKNKNKGMELVFAHTIQEAISKLI